ncbi:hypothetical protein ACFO25_10000 [Paenactinomyces guangxiensis]|uniref:Uncharacterized protein n=1 Tax=Paenactinomyces guangxiensis TaxID=1490290 RepID=A0A7W1WS73_9BACL|nr:hypothetical protein [Paenactinomyces guangxiensis]MBA4495117.1 hypothetical protein [Paenactinomyces guangxiensis]MBH8592199.1 hypothetical protein [Paenactinomyces guangxiensis]
MFQPNAGIKVYGSENQACLVVDHETEKATVLPAREYESALALAERINLLLAESMNHDFSLELRKKAKEAAEEYKAGFDWLKAHSGKLKGPSDRKQTSPFEPEDVPSLVRAIERGYKRSKQLTRFEKAAIRRTLNNLSALERKVFILTKVWGVSAREANRLLKQDVHRQYGRIRKELEKARKKEKTPARYSKRQIIQLRN